MRVSTERKLCVVGMSVVVCLVTSLWVVAETFATPREKDCLDYNKEACAYASVCQWDVQVGQCKLKDDRISLWVYVGFAAVLASWAGWIAAWKWDGEHTICGSCVAPVVGVVLLFVSVFPLFLVWVVVWVELGLRAPQRHRAVYGFVFGSGFLIGVGVVATTLYRRQSASSYQTIDQQPPPYPTTPYPTTHHPATPYSEQEHV